MLRQPAKTQRIDFCGFKHVPPLATRHDPVK
jgi:hypothetical protein